MLLEAEILAVVRHEDAVIEGPGGLEGKGGLTGRIAGIEDRDRACCAGCGDAPFGLQQQQAPVIVVEPEALPPAEVEVNPVPLDGGDGCGAAAGSGSEKTAGCQAYAVADVDADSLGLMDGEIAKGADRRPERKGPAVWINVFDYPVLHARDGRDRAA